MSTEEKTSDEKALDIAALKELCEKATPGPWYRDWHYFVGQVPGGRPGGEVIGRCEPTVDGLRTPEIANVDFICAARSAVPALIAEVERLRDALEKVRAKSWRWKKLADEGPALTPAHVGYDEALRSCTLADELGKRSAQLREDDDFTHRIYSAVEDSVRALVEEPQGGQR